jgi:outer membrane lipoprotein SlyB
MRVVIAAIGAAVMFAGCSNNEYSGNSYDSRNAGEVSRAEQGVVISMREIDLKPEDTMAATALGAVGGGVLGSMFGGGHAKLMTATAGAVAGGVAANQLASRPTKGYEYTVKLDNGSTIVLAQAKDPPISVGQQVRVVYSSKGRSRITPA